MVYTLTVHLYANTHPESIPRLKAKLIEAARTYRQDRETVNWLVMQDVHDPRAFTIVERFETEAVRKIVLPPPYSDTCIFSCSGLADQTDYEIMCVLPATEPEIPP